MAYSTDKTRGTCTNSGRCPAKSVPELFHSYIRPTSQITKKAVNNAVQRHSQAQMSYPAQRPVPHGAEFQPWRCRGVANVFAKPQNAKFSGLACSLRYFNHFCKSPDLTDITVYFPTSDLLFRFLSYSPSMSCSPTTLTPAA